MEGGGHVLVRSPQSSGLLFTLGGSFFTLENDFPLSNIILLWRMILPWVNLFSHGKNDFTVTVVGHRAFVTLHEPLFTVVKQLLSIRIFLLFSIGGKWTSVSAHKNEIKIRRNKLVNFVRRVRSISFDYSKNVPFCDLIKFNSRLKTMSCASRSAK